MNDFPGVLGMDGPPKGVGMNGSSGGSWNE